MSNGGQPLGQCSNPSCIAHAMRVPLYGKARLCRDCTLQARGAELVEEKRRLKREQGKAIPLSSAMTSVLCELHKAVTKHPHFPDDPSAIGAVLAEELLELSTAGMQALQAVNDHRDDGRSLDDVRREIAHVGAVVMRALERLDGAKG